MAVREPFEYAAWCAGPSVDISPPADFPICTVISYVRPTLALHHIDMTLPDLAPPPLCPCIWTYNTEMEDSNFSIEMAAISIGEISGFFEVRPKVGLAQDCCAPEFNVSIDMKLPCMAFEPSLHLSINTGLFSGSFCKDECDLQLNLKLSIPEVDCINFSALATGTFTGVGGKFDVTLAENVSNCQLRLSYKLSIPCLHFNVADAQDVIIGVGGLGGEFDLALSKLANCTLKLSGHLSLPCMPFNVYNTQVFSVVPDAGFDVNLVKMANCTLKLSQHIKFPCMPFNVAVSNTVTMGNWDTPVFDVALKKMSNCTLKLSQHLSLPCMPFEVSDAQDLIIGPGGYGGEFDLALSKLTGCGLKLSGHLSLPGTGLEVLVSAEYANKTFKVWKRTVNLYKFASASEKVIFVAVSCEE